jgi:hypothetical protein
MKVKTARGAVNALPIPNAIAPNRNREGNETNGLLAGERARGSERVAQVLGSLQLIVTIVLKPQTK